MIVNLHNCKYCWTKSSLQNLQENGVTSFWMNLLLDLNIIAKVLFSKIFWQKATFKYCEKKITLLHNQNRSQSTLSNGRPGYQLSQKWSDRLSLVFYKSRYGSDFGQVTCHFACASADNFLTNLIVGQIM